MFIPLSEPDRTIRAHFLAAGYLALVSLVVVVVEAQLGFRLESVWGLQFLTPIVYPLPFWGMTFAYAYVAGRRMGLSVGQWVSRALLLGAWVHLNLLVITMSHQTELLAQLTSGSFLYYVAGVVGAVAVGSCVLSAVYCAAWWRGWRDDFWLPFAYVPLAHVVLQRSFGSLLALAEVGLVIVAVLVADRNIHQRLVAMATRWRPRLVNEATIIVGIYLVAFLFRFAAAQRLSGMGIQTLMTNTDDPDQYHSAALAIVHGEPIRRYTSIGYDMFLAGLYWLTGVRMAWVLALQAALTSTAAVAAYLIGRHLYSRAAGIVAGLLTALSQVLIFNSVNLTREVAGSLFAPWAMALLLLVLSRGHAKKGEWLAVPAGAVFGFLIAYDPAFLIVSGCFIVGWLACTRFTVVQRLKRIALFLAVGFVCAVAIIWFASGDRTILARQDMNLATSVSKDFNPYASLLFEQRINLIKYPSEFVSNVFAAPIPNSTLILQKLWLDARRFLFESNAGRFDPLVLIYASFFASNVDFYGYFFGFVGAWVGLRGILRKPARLDRAALYVFILSYAAVYVILFFGMTRFRVPIQPLLLVLVGAGIWAVFRYAVTGAISNASQTPQAIHARGPER